MPDEFLSKRLILRAQRAQDAVVFRELWRERDHRVPLHRQVDEHGRPSVSDIAERIHIQEMVWWKLYAVELKATGGVLGYCGLVENSMDGLEEPELAFEILQEFQGHGFATEAASEIIAWADSIGMSRLWATVWDWNLASRRVLHKLGFHTTDQILTTTEHGNSLLTLREARAHVSGEAAPHSSPGPDKL